MEGRIEKLEAKVKQLEKNILEITVAQRRTIELINELTHKSADNFIDIFNSLDNLAQKKD